jgi:ribosomal protein S3
VGSFGNTKGLRLGRSVKWSTIRPIVGKDTIGLYQHMYFYEQIKKLFETNTFNRGGFILSHMEVVTGRSEIKVKLYFYMAWLIEHFYFRYRSKVKWKFGKLLRLWKSEKLLKVSGGTRKLYKLSALRKPLILRQRFQVFANSFKRKPRIKLIDVGVKGVSLVRYVTVKVIDKPLASIIRKQMVSLAKYVKIVANNFFVKKVGIMLIGLTNQTVTAEMVCRFLRIKLEQKYTVRELLHVIKRGMRLVKDLRGYQIDFRGRFTRRQRASFERKGVGKMPQSAMGCRIEYAYEQVVLKYGSCGVKVWFYRKGNVAPYGFVATLVA